jgi:hypothetical protein
MKILLQIIFYELYFYKNKISELLFSKRPNNPFDIPIIINNRNRYEYLLRLINSLTKRGYTNIIILDNDSTYPRLLDFYNHECEFEVIFLRKNLGHLALWKSPLYNRVKKGYYVYTDPDLEIYEKCPNDFMNFLLQGLIYNPRVQKIGLGLITDDLPDCYEHKKAVIEWEKKFTSVNYNDNYYKSHVDTTFALYRPFASGGSHEYKLALRSKFPYEVHHLPWYIDSNNLKSEDIYYLQNAESSTFWSKKTINL